VGSVARIKAVRINGEDLSPTPPSISQSAQADFGAFGAAVFRFRLNNRTVLSLEIVGYYYDFDQPPGI
jgi:hypothetical protein